MTAKEPEDHPEMKRTQGQIIFQPNLYFFWGVGGPWFVFRGCMELFHHLWLDDLETLTFLTFMVIVMTGQPTPPEKILLTMCFP